MKLTLKESSLIKPSKPTPSHHLWNSNLDLVVGRIHILTVYFYRPNGSSNFFDTHVLKHALGEVLVSFFPMAGRLGKDGDGRVEIVCNGEGVLFVEAESDCCIDDFGEITPSLELRKLAPTVDYDGGVGSYPLFITQVTRFKCGGVALGCGLHHTLSDGLSSLHFINTWSDIARGLSVAIPPFIDRTLLQARDPPTPMFDHVEYHPPPSLITQSQKSISPSQSKSTSTIMLRLTLDQINKLKSKAKGDGTMHHSTYEILAAHLWRCASKARGLAHDQPTKLYVATDGRSRLNPPLPPGYLGNVVFTATPMAKSGEFETESLSDTARRIHKELGKMDDKYLRSAIDYLELQSDLSALVRGPSYFASPNLNVNSWTRLPIYESDFGWGRPIFMGPAIILYEGTIYIIPHPSGDRSVSLAVCLDPNHMDLFREILYDF
ncbi:Chloramphenicol acetyltransferase-like domain-containing protein [Artemisia annua]|uniref:Chloramphenicol acetyltransferase-like domain-containing protein n=1 Tax=Artemisia annua TaxID=35608 RepID=A0A2U1KRC5_ARTAN|nr:Chloramphenicol acetyltransferase-like domain-containing protein [Artemisia annua]